MNIRHEELYKTLVELYTLQIQLGNIPANQLQIPKDVVFNRDAALEMGYTQEAVRVMANLPYLSDAGGFEIFPSTNVATYTENQVTDMMGYEHLRVLDTNPLDEVYLPPSFLKLTTQNVYGHTFLYDTDTGLVREWRPFYDGIDMDNQGFDSLPAKPPAETFASWIDKYRKLKIFRLSDTEVAWQPDELLYKEPRVVAEAEEKHRVAVLKIRDMYLKNGWNVNTKEQGAFDVAAFLKQRDEYREQVLRPLGDEVSEAYKIAHRQKQEKELRI